MIWGGIRKMGKLLFTEQRGQAMILMTGLLAVLAILPAAALTFPRSQIFSSSQQNKLVKSYYIADAGITRAIANIKSDPGILPGASKTIDMCLAAEYGGGKITTVTLSGPDPDGSYTLTFRSLSLSQFPHSLRSYRQAHHYGKN